MITEDIYQLALACGGCTYDLRRKCAVSEGYAVSPYEFATKRQALTELNLQSYISEHYVRLVKDDHMLGLWFDTEHQEWYYDVSRVMKSKSGAHRIAVQANQLAYFDLKNKTEVRL